METTASVRKDISRLNKQMYHQFQKDWGIGLPSVTQAEIHEQLFLLFDDIASFAEDCRNKIIVNIMRYAEGIDNLIDTLKSVIDKLLSRLQKESDKEIYSETQQLNISSKQFQIAAYLLIDKCLYSNNSVKEKIQFLGVLQVIAWEV